MTDLSFQLYSFFLLDGSTDYMMHTFTITSNQTVQIFVEFKRIPNIAHQYSNFIYSNVATTVAFVMLAIYSNVSLRYWKERISAV